MNKLGLDVTSVGNHEFDEGYKELQRMADGGCIADGDGANNQNSCPDGSFSGANFDYLAANVVHAGTRQDDPAAVRDQERQRRQDRLHRDDPQGHARHRDRGRHPGPRVHRRGQDGQQAGAGAQAARASRRSWCCIHQGGTAQAAAAGRTPRATTVLGNPEYDYTCAKGGSLDPVASPDPRHRVAPRPRDRHGGLRPHPPALRVRRQGPQGPRPARDLGLVVRPAVHRHRAHLRPARSATSCAARSRARTCR